MFQMRTDLVSRTRSIYWQISEVDF